MARLFTAASSHQITLGLGALGFVGPITAAAILRRSAEGTNVWFRMGSTSAKFAFYVRPSTGRLMSLTNGTTSIDSASLTIAASDGWILAATTKATGTATPRFHKYVFSTNTWTHENAGGSLADPATPITSAYIGGDAGSSFWDGDIAAVGAWNVVLTDAQLETLPFSLLSWFQISPKGLWVLDQQAVAQTIPDLSGGGANESARTGTAVSSGSVPLLSYGHMIRLERQPAAAGGGGANSPRDLILLGAG